MNATQFTWLGHATWKIETKGGVIILDPFFDDNPAAPLKAADVHADYLLISHGHFDHVADAASIAQRCGATVVANYEIATWLGKQGVEKTVGMNLGGALSLPFGKAKLVPAWHSSTLPDGSGGGNPGGFLLELPDGKAYFACDTALFSDMKLIGEAGIDLFVCPIGDLFTMGPEEAALACRLLKVPKVIPMHFGTFPPLIGRPEQLAGLLGSESPTEVWPLTPGEPVSW